MSTVYRNPARQAQVEHWRELVREGTTCPECGARRREKCAGGRKRNHLERDQLFRVYLEQHEREERGNG